MLRGEIEAVRYDDSINSQSELQRKLESIIEQYQVFSKKLLTHTEYTYVQGGYQYVHGDTSAYYESKINDKSVSGDEGRFEHDLRKAIKTAKRTNEICQDIDEKNKAKVVIYKNLIQYLQGVDSNLLQVDNSRNMFAPLSVMFGNIESLAEKITTKSTPTEIKKIDQKILELYFFIRQHQGFSSSRLGDALEAVIKSKNQLNLLEKYDLEIPHKLPDHFPIAQQPLVIGGQSNKPILVPLVSDLTLRDTNFPNYIVDAKQNKHLSPLVYQLHKYVHDRKMQESRENSVFGTFFGRLAGMSSELKIQAAEKMLDALNGKKVVFEHDELVALKNQRLGKIIKQYQSELPSVYWDSVGLDVNVMRQRR
jgi:hypothetical protein